MQWPYWSQKDKWWCENDQSLSPTSPSVVVITDAVAFLVHSLSVFAYSFGAITVTFMHHGWHLTCRLDVTRRRLSWIVMPHFPGTLSIIPAGSAVQCKYMEWSNTATDDIIMQCQLTPGLSCGIWFHHMMVSDSMTTWVTQKPVPQLTTPWSTGCAIAHHTDRRLHTR